MESLLERSLIRTNSIERVVAPMATQLCHLILICENGLAVEQLAELEDPAVDVARATGRMADVASRVMGESSDLRLKRDLDPLIESLRASGQHVILVAQKLSIQPHQAEHRDELITAIQSVFMGVLRILLAQDDAAVQRIISTARWLSDSLIQLEKASGMTSLLEAFQRFSSALLKLNDLVTKRAHDLRDVAQRENLLDCLRSFKKCISMLHVALHTTVTQPVTNQTQMAKTYIVDQVSSTITQLLTVLKSPDHNNDFKQKASYIILLDNLLSILSLAGPLNTCDSLLQDLVVHCMVVAKSSRVKHGKVVVEKCQRLLQMWSELSMKTKSLKVLPNSHLQEFVVLSQQLQQLDRALVTAVLYQVFDAFVTVTIPVENLVSVAQQAFSNSSTLQPLLATFISCSNQVMQVASFVSAFSKDPNTVDLIESSTVCLSRLQDHILVFVLQSDGEMNLSGAQEDLLDIQHVWEDETNQLFGILNNTFSVVDFTDLILQQMADEFRDCERVYNDRSHSHFKEHVDRLIGCMKLMVQSVNKHIDNSDNPIFRNGLLVLVKRAAASMSNVTTCVKQINTDFYTDCQRFATFSEKFLMAEKEFHLLKEGLTGLHHPHILSPLREEARQPSASPLTELKQGQVDEFLKSHIKTSNSEQTSLTDTISVYSLQVECEAKPVQTMEEFDLLPVVYKVINAVKGKDLTDLNMACGEVIELSNIYIQAAKTAVGIADELEKQKLEHLCSQILLLTSSLVQVSREDALSSSSPSESFYQHAALFTDKIGDVHRILLPCAGAWFHAIHEMFQTQQESCDRQVREVIRAFTDLVHLMVSSEQQVGWGTLHGRLVHVETTSKLLTELSSALHVDLQILEGCCILWTISVQALLSSVDKITVQGRGVCHLSYQKRQALMSESSLRIQEAATLYGMTSRNRSMVEKMSHLQQEVKTLTEDYLTSAKDLVAFPCSDLQQLSKTEILQRHLQYKMAALSHLLSKVNKEYLSAVHSVTHLAMVAASKNEAEIKADFERAAERLMGNVKIACGKVGDSLNHIQDPRVRTNLRSINEHLTSLTAAIISRARQVSESQDTSDLQSLNVQEQCWSTKAHYIVSEIEKAEGLQGTTKEQIRLGLQGRGAETGQGTSGETCVKKTVEKPFQRPAISTDIKTSQEQESLSEASRNPVRCNRTSPSLTYTALFLKRETDKWDAENNRIVLVTRDMAEKTYHMAQYLRRKGPIQNKEAFISTGKCVVASSRSVTRFIQVIADHTLDRCCKEDLKTIVEQIFTVTNQMMIISSVNALSPGCKSSDEILVKNAQNLLQTILQGIRASETACIKGLREPEPDSDGVEAAALCFQWRQKLQVHRAQQNSSLETDQLGLRRTVHNQPAPSLAPQIPPTAPYM